MSSFYDYFKENMESLGLPAPESLFGSLSIAVGTATTILSQIDKFGKTVTLAEIITAGTRLEQLAIIGACSAAFYAGAVIGSIAVALGRMLGNDTSLADVLFVARANGLYKQWLSDHFHAYPGIYLTNVPGTHYRFGGYRT